jgi:RimJ/RimL family protein N-acetyltransferase
MENPKLNPPSLVGNSLLLRPTIFSDVDEFAKVVPIDTFEYFVSSRPTSQTSDGFTPMVKYMLDSSDIQGFTIEDIKTGRVIGSSSYLDIRPNDKHVEIGMTWYIPTCRGTVVNPECKFLLLQHAFEDLGCVKVTLKCDDRNERSKAAILKLGAKFEGTLRKHRTTDTGYVRDTSYYGILADEWPPIKEHLLARIAAFG